MKLIKIIIISITTVCFLAGCNTRTYEEISEDVPDIQLVSYNEHVKPIVDANCITCHSTGQIMATFPLENYAQVKNAIDNMIDRIERPVGDPQKMPQGGSLSQAQIDIIKQWKTDGLLEN